MMIPMRTLLSVSLAAAWRAARWPDLRAPGRARQRRLSGRRGLQARRGHPAGVATADVGWRDFFTDPLLQRLIEMSLANNRDLRVAALNVEAARAQYRIQRSNLMPSVGLAGKETAQRTPAA